MEIKGMAIAIFEPFLSEKFGQEGYEKWLQALDDESRAIFSQPIDNGRWYQFRTAYSRPTEVLCQMFYNGDTKGAWELGRYSADHAFNWFFKSIIKLTTVRNFITRGLMFMSNYYHPVTLTVISTEDTRIVYRISDFPESDHFVENRIAGWNQRALEIHNCTEVRVNLTKSLARGDAYTELDITWKEN